MKKITKDVYQISLMPRNSINCYLIEDVLIDAGIRSSASRILNAVKDRILSKHVLSHAHADHQGSSSIICDTLNIPLLCSALEKENAENGTVTIEYPNPNHLISKFQQKFWAGEGCNVAEILKEGDKIGGFIVIETPGHSRGHLSFFRENDGVLIAGDTLTNMNLLTTMVGLHQPPSLFTANQEQNIHSIKKLVSLKPKIICFGHGPVIINNGEFERFANKI